MKFVSKPVEIDAYQVTREMLEAYLFDQVPLPIGLVVDRADYHPVNRTISHYTMRVRTIQGDRVSVDVSDWVITEPDGIHFYPCKPDIFETRWSPKPVPGWDV